MKVKTDISIEHLKKVLGKLTLWGELSPSEIKSGKIQIAADLLSDSGLCEAINKSKIILSQEILSVFPAKNLQDLSRKILFRHSGYHRYLTAIASCEIARNGLEGAVEAVEGLLLNDLADNAQQLNEQLDSLEMQFLGKPLKEASPGELARASDGLMKSIIEDEQVEFETWNNVLLGVSGNRDAIFQAILTRKALKTISGDKNLPFIVQETQISNLSEELEDPKNRPVLFPIFSDNDFENESPQATPVWMRRRYVYSSIPLIDETLQDQPFNVYDVQDAMAEHPIPWLLIQLCRLREISQNRQAGLPWIKLLIERNPNKIITDIKIYLDGLLSGSFLMLLKSLIEILGFQLILPFGKVPPTGLDRLIEMMMRFNILLCSKQGELVLENSYHLTMFEKPRYHSLNKGMRHYREKILYVLEKISTKPIQDT